MYACAENGPNSLQGNCAPKRGLATGVQAKCTSREASATGVHGESEWEKMVAADPRNQSEVPASSPTDQNPPSEAGMPLNYHEWCDSVGAVRLSGGL